MASAGGYFEDMKAHANGVRNKYNIATEAFGLREIRAIYRDEGIRIDLWPHKLRKVRAAYVITDDEPSVLLNARMKPVEPRLFSLAHELKHHYVDQDLARTTILKCEPGSFSQSGPLIEIGAEVFAAELIFPEEECRNWVANNLQPGPCTAEAIVRLMRTCPAKISYTFLRKRLTRLRRIQTGDFATTQFKKLEDRLFGVPFYRRKRL